MLQLLQDSWDPPTLLWLWLGKVGMAGWVTYGHVVSCTMYWSRAAKKNQNFHGLSRVSPWNPWISFRPFRSPTQRTEAGLKLEGKRETYYLSYLHIWWSLTFGKFPSICSWSCFRLGLETCWRHAEDMLKTCWRHDGKNESSGQTVWLSLAFFDKTCAF